MDKSKQISHQAADSDITPIKFWGTIVIAALGILANIVLLRNALQLPEATISYVARAFHALVILAASACDPIDHPRSPEIGRPGRVLYGSRAVCIWIIPLC